jgi:hypothetical protein
VGRASALLAVLVALVVWYEVAPELEIWSEWTSILFIALVLIPACFGLVWLALPLWRDRRLPWLGLGFLAATLLCSWLDFEVAANFCKLAAVTLLGWWFLSYFESVSWVVLVAALIPWVDAYSVWRGPTRQITEGRPELFDALSVAFVVPQGAARLGLPDVLFFAVFLGATVRFGLRPLATWIGLAGGLGLTMILATAFDVDGLPALPALSLGFLLPNADLLWRRLRPARLSTTGSDPSTRA